MKNSGQTRPGQPGGLTAAGTQDRVRYRPDVHLLLCSEASPGHLEDLNVDSAALIHLEKS